ncbi:family 43 glycosylhydrolase [Saccharibacillus alkalitolerans]|uniref:Family 43 glycosylhydrolase n=1 Tax=Saccharibacillus alkalitolerans TaxID=2705290 RepID=A0ABX0FDI8_9BACL|nr:family 43 glycosylhydrolase [Saccharibacillus alkalitolerans]NGZ76347.1 family 43 glycosylhydrolase [Saccharibacillus alkalitolerans]
MNRTTWIKGGLALMLLGTTLSGGSFDSAQAASTQKQNDFYNVIMQDGADPFMYRHADGYYYYTKTTGGNVTLWKSKTLTGVDAGETRVIETGGQNVWAPELHHIDGAWYIYYAKDDGDNANHRMYVMENRSLDPMKGTWTDKGPITDSTDRWAIDGTVLKARGELYFIWSGWEGTENVQQILYIAHMSNPWTIDSPRVEIARPEHDWETNHTPYVNEGPQVLTKGNDISVVYSASGSWTDDYSLGLLTAKKSADLLDPASWTKRPDQVFKTGNGVYGPGHASFTKSPDGREDWIVYHAAKRQGSGWDREVRAQRFTWNADKTPNFGTPANPNAPIELPSGEPERDRYEAEDGRLAGTAKVSRHQDSSGGAKVGYIDTPDSYVEIDVNVKKSGTYILYARTGNGTEGGDWSTLKLSVDGGEPSDFFVTNQGWDNWGTSTQKMSLSKGKHTIRFAKGNGYAELDGFDLFRIGK